MNETDTPPAAAAGVECRAAKDPAVRRFIIAAMMVGFGIWCLTDLRKAPEAWDLKHINEAAAYLLNNWGPWLFFPLALVVIVATIIALHRKLTADAQGLGYGDKRIAWSDITAINAKLLESKGILRIETSRGKAMTLDSWKLQNFKALAKFIEDHVPADRIKR